MEHPPRGEGKNALFNFIFRNVGHMLVLCEKYGGYV